jgi:hypothetical protein
MYITTMSKDMFFFPGVDHLSEINISLEHDKDDQFIYQNYIKVHLIAKSAHRAKAILYNYNTYL